MILEQYHGDVDLIDEYVYTMSDIGAFRSKCDEAIFALTCTQGLIKVGLGFFRTNADSQWNPVYNVFHRIFCCGKETIRR